MPSWILYKTNKKKMMLLEHLSQCGATIDQQEAAANKTISDRQSRDHICSSPIVCCFCNLFSFWLNFKIPLD